MAICRSCQRRFQSEQGVKAHMKWCDQYAIKKSKKSAALGRLPKAAATTAAALPLQSIPPTEVPDFSAPIRELEKAMSELPTTQHARQTPQQRRREIVQAAKMQVIDRHRPSSGSVTAYMRGSAKLAIERELVSMPLEELPFEEVLEFAAAIRDGCYAPAFTRQAREATRQHVEEERRHKKEVETLGALIRANRRKKSLIQQASQQAQAFCEEKAITGWAKLSVLGDIESRLEVLLTGDEPILESQAIVRSVLEVRFAEAEATLAAAKAKEDAKWREDVLGLLVLAGLLAVPVLSSKYPDQVVTIINWIERTFGLKPAAEPEAQTCDESEETPSATSAELRPSSRRRRKAPASPLSPEPRWGNPVGGAPGHA
ncbi:MAG: hypothetical protein BVN28_06660 [Nitrospira sp. ST-bin4]|nr:MAG: hypothetical protein BVN28_06660 [Nitrospira sp. ST-bin4]